MSAKVHLAHLLTKTANTNHIRILMYSCLLVQSRTLGLSVFGYLTEMPMLRATTKVGLAKVIFPSHQVNQFRLAGCRQLELSVIEIGEPDSTGRNRAQDESEQSCITRLLPLICRYCDTICSTGGKKARQADYACSWKPATSVLVYHLRILRLVLWRVGYGVGPAVDNFNDSATIQTRLLVDLFTWLGNNLIESLYGQLK